MRIAIVDDEADFLTKLKSLLIECNPDSEKMCISEFSSGESLLKDFKKNMYDIIILDIEMNHLSGLETAEQIRVFDKSAILVFLTSHQEFALQGYEVNAFRYMLKSQPESMYKKQLLSIWNEYHQKHMTFPVESKDTLHNVLISNIIYLEVFKRIIVLHTTERDYEFYGKLSDVESDERFLNFIKPHKSYYINLAFVDNIKGNSLVMKNKATVPVSRNLKQFVTDKFLSYLTERC